MDIEHCECLSWFLRKGESHEQDGERLPLAAKPPRESASGDPAMAFEPSIERTGDHSTPVGIGSGLAAGRSADGSGIRFETRKHAARNPQRRMPSRSINDL